MLTAHGSHTGHSHGTHAHGSHHHHDGSHHHEAHNHSTHAHAPHSGVFHPPEFHAHTVFPPMPEIGLSEHRYTRLEREAGEAGDRHAREAWKVAQYVTLALKPGLPWSEKLRYFNHALHHHCVCPPLPDDATWAFYHDLMSLVRDHAGAEALRLASKEDEVYAKWVSLGCTRDRIDSDAEAFFYGLMGRGEKCPEHFHEEDWEALKVFRNQWL
jgi:hypothetical protein